MTRTRALIIVGIAALVAVVLWWTHHPASVPSAVPAAVAHEQATGSSSAPAATVATKAHVTVRVRDDAGPLAATVRMTHDGDVTLGKAGEPIEVERGEWKISASAPDHEPVAVTREIQGDDTVDIVLPRGGRTLTGTVTDASGGAVAGARIDAAKVGALARPGDAVATTLTGADGHYRMTVAEGTLLVAAQSADYAPQSRYVEVAAAGATADFALVPGGVIEGIVRDARTHDPVAATVHARRDSGAARFGESMEHTATAGPDGRFRITGLGPGAYELRALAGGRRSLRPTIVGLGVAEQVTDVEILVGAGPVVRGVAVDEAGGPAVGVAISTFGGDEAEATTDAKGAFALEGLAPGRYMVMGNGNGYVAAGATSVEVGSKDVDGVHVTVRRGAKVRGHVEPRQVCEVRLDFDDKTLGPREMPMLVSPVTTGPDGEFELPPASPLPYVLAARCPSGDQGSQPITLAAGMPDVVVHVAPGASIAGKVVDDKGKPVAAVTVMAAPKSGTERTVIVNGMVTSGAQVLTDAAGKFELRGLSADSYHLSVLDRGKPLPMKSDVSLTLSATEHKTGVELAVTRPDGTIRGTVVGADGQPIADAWVSVHQDLDDLIGGMGSGTGSHMITVQATDDGTGADSELPAVLTDASGHFEISGLPRSLWTVIAEAQHGALRGRQTRVTPDATVTVKALGVTDLHGTVHGASGVFTVELDGPTHQQRSFASTDGTFSFGRVDPGAYTVRVTSTAGNGEAQVEVVAGESANVDIALASNAVVTGTVVDAQGKPVAGAGVAVVPDAGDGHIRIALEGPPPMTNPDGTFRLEAKAGPSALAVLTPPSPTIKRGLTLTAGQTLDVGTVKLGAPN